MRRAANPTRKISITIAESTFNELNRVLSYTQSRSKYIDGAIVAKLSLGHAPFVHESSTRQLMAALVTREDVDETMRARIVAFAKAMVMKEMIERGMRK